MRNKTLKSIERRAFLAHATQAGLFAGAALGLQHTSAAKRGHRGLQVGEAQASITPPLGIELAGFHKPIGQPRLIEGTRQKTAVRVLVMQQKCTTLALVSLDILGLSEVVAMRVANKVEAATGIPAANVRICATHTHSMPTFVTMRQWGAIPPTYMGLVEQRIVECAIQAVDDLMPAELSLGKQRCVGGNFNRTLKTWKNDDLFEGASTHDERWLDTMLHVLYFERASGARPILWYHFSSHPVCYADGLSGPDWPGIVDDHIRKEFGVTPSFLQGHAGDVNPGHGDPWRGEAEQTAGAIFQAIQGAMNQLERVQVDGLASKVQRFELPLDLALFQQWLDEYETDPADCNRGPWVDAGFARAWYTSSKGYDNSITTHGIQLSAMRIGSIGLVFHPSELYSYYGLVARRDSPFDDTLVVGYADDYIGYLTDPKAYEDGEYAAIVVPKICDLPPFARHAAAEMTHGMKVLLNKLHV